MNRAFESRPRRPSRLAFDISRIVVDVGVLLVLGAMSLPFVVGEDFRQRAVAGDGLVALLLVAPVFLMTVLPDQSRPLPRPLAAAALLLAGAALPYTAVKYLDASTLAGTMQGSVGTGARVLVIGAFTVLAGLVLGLIRSRQQPGADSTDSEAAWADALPEEAPPAPSPATAPSLTGAPRRQPRLPISAGSGRPASSEAPQARVFPRWKRPRGARPPAPAQPAPAAGRVPMPASQRPPAAAPRPTDPDTGPTLPAQRPVQPWWPDDLEDLFS